MSRFPFLSFTILIAALAPSIQLHGAAPVCSDANTIHTEVVAIEHAFQYNRFGAFNPAGMIFALRHDVLPSSIAPDKESGYFQDPSDPTKDKSAETLWKLPLEAGKVRLRGAKRPRPLVLRIAEGECLHVVFTNLLSPVPVIWTDLKLPAHALAPTDDSTRVPFIQEESEYPATRDAAMHVNGLDYVNGPGQDDGANIGNNKSSLAAPGGRAEYTWYGQKEGGYLLFSSAATTGGEGDGGQIGLGLFGSVNVEPKGSKWYRSQVTNEVISEAAMQADKTVDYSKINYDRIAMVALAGDGKRRLLIHSDINAIIVQEKLGRVETAPRAAKPVAVTKGKFKSVKGKLVAGPPGPPANTKAVVPTGEAYCAEEGPSNTCGESFREFTVIFHDEITAQPIQFPA